PGPTPVGGEDASKCFVNMPLALAPAGNLAAIGSRGGPLVLWQPGVAPPRQRNVRLFPPGHEAHVRAVAFSPDGRYVAATHPDGLICLLRLAGPRQVPEVPG